MLIIICFIVGSADQPQDAKRMPEVKLCSIMTSSKPIFAVREVLKSYLMGSFYTEEETENIGYVDTHQVDNSDVKTVCNMLGRETFKKNDLLVCLLSSLLGIVSSDVMRNDYSLQYDIACKTINLLTTAVKEVHPYDSKQFDLIISFPLVIMVETMPSRQHDFAVESSIFDNLLKYGSNLLCSASSAKAMADKEALCVQVHNVLIGCHSLLFWQLQGCHSSITEVITLYRKFASSEIFRLTEKFLRLMVLMNVEEEFCNFAEKSVEDFCVVFGKTAKKFHKIPRKCACIFTPDVGHNVSSKRKQQGSARRTSTKRDQKSSSESDKESEEDNDIKEVGSDVGSDSTGNMSDYVLCASDSDDSKPSKSKHKRNPSNASARSKEGNVIYTLFLLKTQTKC